MHQASINALPLALPAILLVGCQGARPADLGVHDGKLLPCPSSHNCVSSQAADEGHRVAPLPYTGTAEEALMKLKVIVRSLPRTTIVTETTAYLHAESASFLFRFVDDVEFLVDDRAKVIHVRSASRLGYSDLGANGRRIELIREHWQKTIPAP